MRPPCDTHPTNVIFRASCHGVSTACECILNVVIVLTTECE